MGNQSSKPPGLPSSPTAAERREKEKKVDRRTSIQALGAGKGTAADPSASHASATAQNISQPCTQKPLQEHIHAAHSPELAQKAQDKPSTERSREPAPLAENTPLQHRPKDIIPQEPSEPVDVPSFSEKGPSLDAGGNRHPEQSVPSYMAEYAKLQRPPRLPLPIAEVDHVPGSPLLEVVATGDEDVSIFEDDAIGLARKGSTLSSTTVDEEEIGDELIPYAVETSAGAAKVVPTTVKWESPGDKVYVTGTFNTWEKKYKLHKSKSGDCMAVVLQLPPGTHHLKFIVDGEMKASDHLPTAVDYNNALVNYIEVIADARSQPKATGGKDIPGSQSPQMHREDERAETPDSATEEASRQQDTLLEEEILEADFRQLVPAALVNIDYNEKTPEYKEAFNLIAETPGPPSLPLFLARSILNGSLPMKDDSSVLTLPNHTVLNHLATSSIKNGVLATSVTTRHRKKYVTTVMYKPTNLDQKREAREAKDTQVAQDKQDRQDAKDKKEAKESKSRPTEVR